jgi:peptidoglycan/LPS O-acetylase OafA/YrhL
MNETIKRKEIRYDLQTLRALAAISVILFHLKVDFFKGGYLGVDIFFVISGYFITKILIEDYKINKKINFSKFIISRFKKIFPSLFFIIFLVLIISIIFIPKKYLIDTANYSIYSTLLTTNIYAWLTSGYFETDTILKPLIHTWTLGVEIFFYLFWLILFLIICKLEKIKRILIISFFLTLSFLLTFFFYESHAMTFYLAPFRVFEFALGSFAYEFTKKNLDIKKNIFISLILLFFIFVCFYFYNENTPTYLNIFPCLIVSFLIKNYNLNDISKLYLKPLVNIGNQSYSLYLIHWPVIVFYFYYNLSINEKLTKLLLFTVIISLGYINYTFIEKKFHKIISFKNTLYFCLCTSLATIILSLVILKTNYMDKYLSSKKNDQILEKFYQKHKSDNTEILTTDKKSLDTNDKILVLGDSIMPNIVNMLNLSKKTKNFSINSLVYDDLCFLINQKFIEKIINKNTDKCIEDFKKLNKSIYLKNSNIIIVANWWKPFSIKNLEPFINYLKGKINENAKIIILSNKPQFDVIDLNYLKYTKNPTTTIEKFFYQNQQKDKFQINEKMKYISEKSGIKFLNFYDLVCKIKLQECYVIYENDILYSDRVHFNSNGELFFSEAFTNQIFKLANN